MIPTKDFIVVELDLHARYFKKLSLGVYNERRKEEFARAHFFKYLLLAGVFETETEANEYIEKCKKDMGKIINSLANEEVPY